MRLPRFFLRRTAHCDGGALGAMGGWMSYQRMRNRNGLMYRKPDDDPDPYFRNGDPDPEWQVNRGLLIGDINRMERDYLDPRYPEHPYARYMEGSSPAEQCATATGVPLEDVRKVLRYVFLEQS